MYRVLAADDEAVNGEQALLKIQTSEPDVVLMDIRTPGSTGRFFSCSVAQVTDSVFYRFVPHMSPHLTPLEPVAR